VLLFMTAMDHTHQTLDESTAPHIPDELSPPIESRFLFVDVAALRAKQLKRGARPRLGDEGPQVPHKLERVAMEEVRRGLVHYDIRQPIPPPSGEADV
jgi:DNA-directed RNA polymerase omega subunit